MHTRLVRSRRAQWRVAGIVGVLLALLGTPIAATFAHSNHDHKMYVAPIGRDQGACDQPWLPCKTIMYAIQQGGGQGGEVRVAAGEYFFAANEVLLLIGNQVPVKGGWSIRDSYAKQDLLANPTYIAGIPSRYRARLAERGFARVEDREQREEANDVTPGLDEVVLPHEIATPASRQNCVGGMAGIFPCRGIDFLGSVPLNQFIGLENTASTDGSNLWGHVDLNTGREYAVFGVNEGTGVVDVSNPEAPLVIGTVPGVDSIWREVKVYQFFNASQNRWNAYAYISTEGQQGLQIVDLNHLSDPNPTVSLATTYNGDFTTSHTVYIKNVDYSTNTALPNKKAVLYMNGVNRSGGVFRAFDITNPVAPSKIDSGIPDANISYTHDDTTMVITDTRTSQCAANHNPCEVLFDFSEDSVVLWDVTSAAAPVFLSETPYAGSGYTHSGWYTDDKMHLFIQDELDEIQFGHNSRVRTLDIANLAAPSISATWNGPTRAIDHNGYTIGNKYYMSNYRRGLTILDVTDPNAILEGAFFDTYLGSDSANFNGAWGVYPFLPSGNLLISDIERGLIVVRLTDNATVEQVVSGLTVLADSPTVLPTTTTFTATLATGTNVRYAWNFGDGTAVVTTTSPTITHTYANLGTYSVTVTASNRFNRAGATTNIRVTRLWWFPLIQIWSEE